MNHFTLVGGELCAEHVPLSRIVERVGTPCYVYSKATLVRHFRVLSEAFAGVPHVLCYSVKASSNLALLRLLGTLGAGFDIVSGGELARVLAAGNDARRVVFSGVGKTRDEMEQALRAGVMLFNVESEEELEALDAVARRLKVRAPFALRVNPAVDPRTHHYISTGLRTSKFGVPFGDARRIYRRSLRMKGLIARGLDMHIGSQLTEARPLEVAVEKVAALYRALVREGFELSMLDIGGGLGIRYDAERPPSVREYARVVSDALGSLGATLVLEPGRVLVGNAGVLVTRVLYRKRAPAKRYLIVDAGMNDLVRPALYQAHHGIEPVRPRRGKPQRFDVAGPVCESSDVLGRARRFVDPRPGDLLAIRSAGAYGMSMSSSYNSRPRPAEVLVSGSRFRVIRAREELADLWRGEAL